MIHHSSDRQFPLPAGSVRLHGIIDTKIRLVADGVLKTIDMHALADYFRLTRDMFATGEFWGKIMRASCLIASYTGDEQLLHIIDTAVDDMLSIARPDGCISTCPDALQPQGTHGSDLWERKYVLMGLLEYYDLRGRQEVLDTCLRLVHYTAGQVGNPPKRPITETGWAFGGIESASILEPVMRVAQLTGDDEALAFARYIVSSGCCKRENIFAAIRSGKSPYRIGDNGNPKESIAKAYEMMSCFEGLMEYARVTGDEEAQKTALLFWDKVREEEITLLGSGGGDTPFNLGPGTGEQWNRTAFEQTNPNMNLMMETCVTVYWMRLCWQMLRLTGEVRYADALEVSLYNAICGALRPDGNFFEYFPRFNGERNAKVNYSFNINGFDLSCCTANGPTALGMAPYLAFTQTPDGCAVNFFESGTFTCPHQGGTITFVSDSAYPKLGYVKLSVSAVSGNGGNDFALSLRVPTWAEGYFARVNGVMQEGHAGQYLPIRRDWKPGDEVVICFDIPIVRHDAPHGSDRRGDRFTAFTYGSILLARDSRFCSDPLSPIPSGEVTFCRIGDSPCGGYLRAELCINDELYTLIDYQSAGNAWTDGNVFASWIPL